LRAGRLDQAAELAARGAGYDPAAAHALSAEIALAAGNLERAETEAREAAAAGGGRPGPSLVLADVLMARGQPVKAVEVLQRALADGLDDESVRVKLARILLGGGEVAAAEQALAGLEASTQPETLLVMGRVAAVQQRWDEAGRFFDRALVSDPGNPMVTINLGILALGRGRAAEARPLLERGVRGAPGSFEGWNALGVARAQTGDADGAISAWERALELQPQAVDLLFNLGLAHAQAGHSDRAADYLESFVERAPDGPVRERAREMARQLRRSGG
jgi:predicted Zn-dependent protease